MYPPFPRAFHGFQLRFLDWIWNAEEGRYVRPQQDFLIDASGDKRDYGYLLDDKGQQVRVSLPGEDRFARAPRRTSELEPWEKSFQAGLEESLFKFEDEDERR